MNTPAFTGAPNSRFQEWLDWASTSDQPSQLLRILKDSGDLQWHAEIHAMDGVKQESRWHPEGSVEVHTGHVMDAAAAIARREKLRPEQRGLLVLAALCHDFGKATMTRTLLKNGQPYISSEGHEQASGPLATRFLRRLGADEDTIAQVVPLVENHMAHVDYLQGAGEIEVVRLAQNIAPATLELLVYLIEADLSGRPPLPQGLPPGGTKMVEAARIAGVLGSKNLPPAP